mgnify:CR=1 FL=1
MPGKVLEIVDDKRDVAAVEISGVRRNINIALLKGDDRPSAGDWVLVHLGFAMNRMDESEAIESQEMLEGFGDIFDLNGLDVSRDMAR